MIEQDGFRHAYILEKVYTKIGKDKKRCGALPLMMPVTVPRLLLLPLMDGSSARSAATADVMMLLGPPTKHPMKAKSMSKTVTGIWSMYSANTYLLVGERVGKEMGDVMDRTCLGRYEGGGKGK